MVVTATGSSRDRLAPKKAIQMAKNQFKESNSWHFIIARTPIFSSHPRASTVPAIER
jgi:hypothetical protein